MVAQIEKRDYTPEEYLALEEKSLEKHEYRDGEIIAMPGGTTAHNQITLNFCRKFPLSIADQEYYLYMNDVRLWIAQYRLYTYPDIMIIKGHPIYEGDGTVNVTNPLIIIEVLSQSTRNYDWTDKFKFYRSIPGFQEYLLIDQSRYYVAQYVCQESNKWFFQDDEGEEAILKVATIDFEISFQDLYQRVDFSLDDG